MTASNHPTLDPVAFEVLREIAGQPDSVLLRAPLGARRGRPLDAFLPREPLSAGAALLSSAERHLLSVHREEVAAWLRLAAFQGIFEDPSKTGLMGRELDAQRMIELPGRQALTDRVHRLFAVAEPGALPAEALPSLRRAALSRPLDPWELAALSLRLEPHLAPRQWFASRAIERGQLGVVRQVLGDELHLSQKTPIHSASQRACVQFVGSLATARGDWESAEAAYQRAACSPYGGKRNSIWWALNAAQLGDQDRLRAAQEHCEATGALEPKTLQGVTATLEVAAKAYSWAPTEAAKRLLSRSASPLEGAIRPWLA